MFQLHPTVSSGAINDRTRKMAVVPQRWENVIEYRSLNLVKLGMGKIRSASPIGNAGEPHGFKGG